MADLRGTKTEKNLMEAFAGESQARNKYTYFASKAKKEGYEQIAALFLETAENEKEMLEKMGLSDRMDHAPSQLSGGQQQRVAIARALINRPPVLFADEPTGNLDSKTSVDVMKLFEELNAEGITIILVTHSTEVADCAKRTIHIHDGSIVSGAFTSASSISGCAGLGLAADRKERGK